MVWSWVAMIKLELGEWRSIGSVGVGGWIGFGDGKWVGNGTEWVENGNGLVWLVIGMTMFHYGSWSPWHKPFAKVLIVLYSIFCGVQIWRYEVLLEWDVYWLSNSVQSGMVIVTMYIKALTPGSRVTVNTGRFHHRWKATLASDATIYLISRTV